MSKHERVKFHTNLDPSHSCGLATMEITGIDPVALTSHLWKAHKIIVTPIEHEDFRGIRVTPNVYTTTQELDLFCDAIDRVVSDGLPDPKSRPSKSPATKPASEPATTAPDS